VNSKSMAGWIGFAGILLVMVGGLDFFQGLIALFEDEYWVPTESGFLVFDATGWGWVMLFWGLLLALAGFGLLAGQGWARWFAIVVVVLNVIGQLGFLGNTQNPLWSLTVIALNIIVLFALTARWSESQAAPQMGMYGDQGGGEEYSAEPAAPAEPDPMEEVEKLAKLHKEGVLTDEEFAAQKAKLLG
jgi:Short C-terminal domain